MHPLSNVYVWHVFRLFLEGACGVYSKRITLLKELGLKGTESVLDIGCGTGEFAVVTTGRYLGVDLNPQYIEFARKRHPGKEFACADVADLSAKGAVFDCVLLVDVIHHLSDEQFHKLLSNLAQLAPQRVYIIEPVLPPSRKRMACWIVAHDRGRHFRSRDKLLTLLNTALVIHTIHDSVTRFGDGVCVVGQPHLSETEDSR